MKRNIIIEPDPILRKSQSLEKVDKDIKKLMDDMLETMYKAPDRTSSRQIGILKRVVLQMYQEMKTKNPIYLVNPVILERSTTSVYEEGCLSLPEQYAEIEGQIVV